MKYSAALAWSWLILLVAVSAAAADEPRIVGRTRQVLVRELSAASGQEQIHAAWALSQLAAGSTAAAAPEDRLGDLNLLAQHDNPSVRYWGLIGLRQLLAQLPADHSLRETAIEHLTPKLADPSLAARIAAAEALAAAGRPREALPVLALAMQSPQESVRIQAVAALERLGPAARPARDTLQAATNDASEYVKRISTRALGRLGD